MGNARYPRRYATDLDAPARSADGSPTAAYQTEETEETMSGASSRHWFCLEQAAIETPLHVVCWGIRW